LSALQQSPSNAISVTFARQFLAFATLYDPNASTNLPIWPLYTTSNASMLQYKDDSITIIADDFRSDAINILNSVDIQSATGR